jgi:hypothetical protein
MQYHEPACEFKEKAMQLMIKAGLIVTGLGWMLATSPAMSQSVIEAPPMNDSDSQGQTPTTGMPDPYLWHVTGLPQGSDLPVLSGAGPNFRIINTLNEGTPVDRQTCTESRGGYWCRIATYDRPRISGWVDGRFLKKTGGEPEDSIGGLPGGPYLDMPIRPRRDRYGDWHVPNAFGSGRNGINE